MLSVNLSGTLPVDFLFLLVQFIQNHYTVIVAVHVLAMAIGLGGATVSDILFFKFLKDFRISKKEAEVLSVLKNVIMTVIFFIVLTGAILLTAKPSLASSGPFLVKTIASVILVINGICLHVFIAPHLIHLNLKGATNMSRSWHRLSFALGAISICSWYSVFLIASLKSILPKDFTLLLLLYLSTLVCATVVSQLFEMLIRTKARQSH